MAGRSSRCACSQIQTLLVVIGLLIAVVSSRVNHDAGRKLFSVQLTRSPSLHTSLTERGASSDDVVMLAEYMANLELNEKGTAEEEFSRRSGEISKVQAMLSDIDVAHTEHVYNPYSFRDGLGSHVSNHLMNVMNDAYFGEIGVGTPPQKIYLQFDSGSATLWTTSSRVNCHKKATHHKKNSGIFLAGNATGCPQLHKYNHDLSSTYRRSNRPFQITYGSGLVSGFYSYDAVHFNGGVLKNARIGEATLLSLEFRRSRYDGIMGLGREGLGLGKPIVYTMKDQGLIDHRSFSVFLTKRHHPVKKAVDGGVVVFGGVDPKHVKGQIYYTPLLGSFYWTFTIKSFTIPQLHHGRIVDTVNVCPGGCKAMADTGTTLIIGPDRYVNKINRLLGAPNPAKKILGVFTELKCNGSHPNIRLGFGSFSISLTASTYLRRRTLRMKSGKVRPICISVFLASSIQPDFIFGCAFLQSFLTVFDYESGRIGFARLAH